MENLDENTDAATAAETDCGVRHYRVAHLAARLSSELKHVIENRMQQAGLSNIASAHGDILAVLFARTGGVSMSEIARASGRTKATVTVLVGKLEALGYVCRRSNENDARSSLVELTEKGAALRTVFEEISCELDAALLKALGKRRTELLEASLARAVQELETLP